MSGSTPQCLLYDGHGSTRQLSQTAGTGSTHVAEQYNYDAYGVGLSLPGSPATSLLYSGEQWDSALSQYYLRARYYDPSNDRFNQRDPAAGNNFDPQSLHKYAYAHNDPVNGVDPSGLFFDAISTLFANAISATLRVGQIVGLGVLAGAGVGAVGGAAVSGYLHILRYESFEGLSDAMATGAVFGAIQGAIVGASAVNPVALAVTLTALFGINTGLSLPILTDKSVNKQTKTAVVLMLVLQGWFSIRGFQAKFPQGFTNPLTASIQTAFDSVKGSNKAMIGWIETSGKVRLLPLTDDIPFDGHEGAQAAGVIPSGSRGFSVVTDAHGKVGLFKWTSGINEAPEFALPRADAVALVNGLPMADNAVIFPPLE